MTGAHRSHSRAVLALDLISGYRFQHPCSLSLPAPCELWRKSNHFYYLHLTDGETRAQQVERFILGLRDNGYFTNMKLRK